MCGICGSISPKQINIQEMIQTLKHRGPDHQGIYKEKNLSLAHARLSILDLSNSANQPMKSENENFVMVYNGEVYNFQNIRAELYELGHTFKTSSDTEVILKGFIQWGTKLFEKLNGMFALSIYDKKENKLFIARDRFGIKPLYYYHDNNDFLFASEIKSILASGAINKELSYQGLHEYMHFSSTLGESTFYHGIKKLLPGHYLTYDLEQHTINIKSYKLNYDIIPSTDSIEDAIENIRYLFEQSVTRQLVADVPIGIFLSGGIDSTAITALASKHYKGKLKTFSAGFDFDKGFNEPPNAKYISEKFNTEHKEFHIKGDDTISMLEEVNYFFDQPFGDAANIPLYLMGKELKGNHKVILQGDGGDELFAGYRHYSRVKNEKAFKFLSHAITAFDRFIPKSSKHYRAMRTMYAMKQKNRSLVAARFYSQDMITEESSRLFQKQYREKLNAVNPFKRHLQLYPEFSHMNLLQELLFTDMNVILPDQYLEKVDRATMANSLEIRVPFLDNDLATYAMSLPSHYKVQGKEKKYLLKKAFEGIVPDKILYGPKRGFGVPFQYWLKSSMKDFMKDQILSSSIYTPEVEKMMKEHIRGERDHGFVLWKLLNLSMWLNKNKEIQL